MGPHRGGLLATRPGPRSRRGDPQGRRAREGPRRRRLRLRRNRDDHPVPPSTNGLRGPRDQRPGGRALPRTRARTDGRESRNPRIDGARRKRGSRDRPRRGRRSDGRGGPGGTLRWRRRAARPFRASGSTTWPRRPAIESRRDAKLRSIGADVTTVDGWRLQFNDGWSLVRFSGTEPKIRVMTESRDTARANEIYSTVLSSAKGAAE